MNADQHAEYIAPPYSDDLITEAFRWASMHAWACSTRADWYGHDGSRTDDYDWCVGDPDEDDPPIFDHCLPEDAKYLVVILDWVGRQLPAAQSDGSGAGGSMEP